MIQTIDNKLQVEIDAGPLLVNLRFALFLEIVYLLVTGRNQKI